MCRNSVDLLDVGMQWANPLHMLIWHQQEGSWAVHLPSCTARLVSTLLLAKVAKGNSIPYCWVLYRFCCCSWSLTIMVFSQVCNSKYSYVIQGEWLLQSWYYFAIWSNFDDNLRIFDYFRKCLLPEECTRLVALREILLNLVSDFVNWETHHWIAKALDFDLKRQFRIVDWLHCSCISIWLVFYRFVDFF